MSARRDRWIVKPGASLSLADRDPRDASGAPGGKKETKALLEYLGTELAGLQERLYAESKQALLVVLQAMDAGGKDGTIKHVFRGVNPQGVRVTSFKAADRGGARARLPVAHPRERAAGHGDIGIFNRSHYEDVLIVRVHDLVPGDGVAAALRPHQRTSRRILPRRGHPRREVLPAHLARGAGRAAAGAARPTRRSSWKFNPADLAERERWDDYQAAYEEAIRSLHRARPVVRDPGRPQVVPQLGDQPHRDRDARGHGPALSRAAGGLDAITIT